MHVDDSFAAPAFVEVVDVLGNHGNGRGEAVFQFAQGPVGGIGLNFRGEEFAAPGVVEAVDQGGVPGEALGGGYVFHSVVFPESVGGPEGGYAGFGGDAGAGEDDDSPWGHG